MFSTLSGFRDKLCVFKCFMSAASGTEASEVFADVQWNCWAWSPSDQQTSDDLVSPLLAIEQSRRQVRSSSGDNDGMTITVKSTEVLSMTSVETCSSRL